jgi:hypothetical protein
MHGDEKYIHFQFDTSRAGSVANCWRRFRGHAGHRLLCRLKPTPPRPNRSAWPIWPARRALAEADQGRFDRTRSSGRESVREARLRVIAAAGRRIFHGGTRSGRPGLRANSRGCSLAVDHAKAVRLQQRIRKHRDEWLTFLDDPRVPPTNNLAERALRPLVVLRKITFGHRTLAGGQRMATIMTVQETAKRHGHKASDIFYRLLTEPPNRVLEHLYAGGKR